MTDICQRPIYFDNHATTPVDPRIADVIVYTLTSAFGNALSVEHAFGEEAAEIVARAGRDVAGLVGSRSENVHFTPGSSEGIRLAIAHAVSTRPHPSKPLRVAASTVEHRAVLDVLNAFQRSGDITTEWIPVDRQARIELAALASICARGADLVCVMAANNEVGTIYPIHEVAEISTACGARLLVDATQAVGKIPVSFDAWQITYLVLSAHKIYGPKGVGALVVSDTARFRPADTTRFLATNGTPNVPGIAGFGEACRLRRVEMREDEPRIAGLRNRLEGLLRDTICDLVINGDRACRLSGSLHVSVPGVPNDAVIARVRRQLAISTGSACASRALEPSHVLRAMGLPPDLQDGALRIGLGKFNTEDEVERAAEYLALAVQQTRQSMGS